MKKRDIVKNKRQFNEIIANAPVIKNEYYIIHYQKTDLPNIQFGIAVGTKLGNAVTRNKLKRQIKSIIDQHNLMFPKGYNYIIILRKAVQDLSYQEKELNLCRLVEKVPQ